MDEDTRQAIKTALNAFNSIVQSYDSMQHVLNVKLSTMADAAKQILKSVNAMTTSDAKLAIVNAFDKALDNVILHAFAYEELLEKSNARILEFKNSMQSSLEIDKLACALDDSVVDAECDVHDEPVAQSLGDN